MIDDFAAQLKEWRRLAKVSRADIDNALLAEGIVVCDRYTAQIENHRLRAPIQRDICEVIGRVLGMDGDHVWRQAGIDILTKAGALSFHEEMLRRERDGSALVDLREENERLRAILAAIRAQTEGL